MRTRAGAELPQVTDQSFDPELGEVKVKVKANVKVKQDRSLSGHQTTAQPQVASNAAVETWPTGNIQKEDVFTCWSGTETA
mmetsp:Transcript_58928/g.124993  ORF Transcript_58928/g.124993 Transcript_58928/m.124993 type:complete len:81 (+) Transcript_58928:51-293(+)